MIVFSSSFLTILDNSLSGATEYNSDNSGSINNNIKKINATKNDLPDFLAISSTLFSYLLFFILSLCFQHRALIIKNHWNPESVSYAGFPTQSPVAILINLVNPVITITEL